MEEGSGTTVADSSGNSHTLTLANFNFDSSSGWTTDMPPASLIPNTGSLLFDGIDDVGLADSHPSFNFSSSFTLEAWIRAESQGGDIGILSKWGVSGSSVVGYMMYFGGGKILNFINSNAGPTSSIDLRGDNTWHHIATVWDGSQRKIYVDGVLQASASWTEAPLPIDISFMVGNYFAGGDPRNFKGNIDEVKIYNTARTQAEIREDAGFTVVLNEFMPKPGDNKDWVEIYNISSNPIDITGWKLVDTTGVFVTFSAILAPDSFLVATESARLNNGGDTIFLTNSDNAIVDTKSYTGGEVVTDNSIGRNPDGIGNWKQCATSSANVSNDLSC